MLKHRHNRRTDEAHLFRWVSPSQSTHRKNKKSGFGIHFWKIRGGYFGQMDLKWVAVARFGPKMGGNEAHEVQDHF